MIRDGRSIETLNKEDISEDRIITLMVGRSLDDRYPPREPNIGEVVFEVKDWSVYHQLHRERQVIKNIGINVRKGEVVGIAGLMGSGRTEFAMSVFGKSYGQRISGEVFMNGKKVDTSTVEKAVANGIAYATEDRKTYGLNLIDHISDLVKPSYEEGRQTNFQRASCTLDAGVKIYAYRVDSVHSDVFKVMSGLSRSAGPEPEEAAAGGGGPQS